MDRIRTTLRRWAGGYREDRLVDDDNDEHALGLIEDGDAVANKE